MQSRPVPWTMPEWMEPYRESVCNTGGNSVEELMNDKYRVFENVPRALLVSSVLSQINLLYRLHKDGHI